MGRGTKRYFAYQTELGSSVVAAASEMVMSLSTVGCSFDKIKDREGPLIIVAKTILLHQML
jgi:hypothetical protein